MRYASSENLVLTPRLQTECHNRHVYKPIDSTTTEFIRLGRSEFYFDQCAALGSVSTRQASPIALRTWSSKRRFIGAKVSGLGPRILTWNAQLAASARAFSAQHPDASVLVGTTSAPFTVFRINLCDLIPFTGLFFLGHPDCDFG